MHDGSRDTSGDDTGEERELAPSAWERSRRHTVLVVIAPAVAAALVLPFIPAFLG